MLDTSQWTTDFFYYYFSLVNCKDNSEGNQICVIHSVSSERCEYLGNAAGLMKMPFNSIRIGVWYDTKKNAFTPAK